LGTPQPQLHGKIIAKIRAYLLQRDVLFIAPTRIMSAARPSSAQHLHRRASRGYTLVEMLMVLSIMVVLFAVAARGARKSWEGQEIKASAMKLAGDISLASMTATKLNRPVQLRFYQYDDENVATASPQFHAYQLVVERQGADVARWEPLYEVQRLEGTPIMSAVTPYSTLLAQPTAPDLRVDAHLASAYAQLPNLKYTAVEFRPDGSTNLDPQAVSAWTVTLVPVRAADDGQGQLPPYFQTLALAPETGAVRIF